MHLVYIIIYQDSTDEIGCSVVNIDTSYNRFLSPPHSSPTQASKLSVNVSLTIHSINGFDPILSMYENQFTVVLKWYDGRLLYNNLRKPPKINAMRPNEYEQIWFPDFIFRNTKKKVKSLIDDNAALKVVRKGIGTLSGLDETENKYVFYGHENYIQYERFYSQDFECEYHLNWYPFDSQICYLDIKPSSGKNNKSQILSFLVQSDESW